MSTTIETIAIEMIFPAEDEIPLPPLLLGSAVGVEEVLVTALADGLGDLDLDGFGDGRAVFVGVGVGDGARDARA